MFGKKKKQNENVSDEQILRMAKNKCPEALRGFLPNDEIMLKTVRALRK